MNRLGARWRGPPVAAALALGVPLALVWWAFPEALPWWRSVAIVSGWAGTGLLLASLVLMVREPRIAGLMGGLETAYRWHHRSGMAAYLLLLVHPLALAADGQAESPARAWQILAPWAQSWPVWLGWAALVLLMIGLAATFALHLPYRRWRGLHLVLAAGVPVGLTHVVGGGGGPRPGGGGGGRARGGGGGGGGPPRGGGCGPPRGRASRSSRSPCWRWGRVSSSATWVSPRVPIASPRSPSVALA